MEDCSELDFFIQKAGNITVGLESNKSYTRTHGIPFNPNTCMFFVNMINPKQGPWHDKTLIKLFSLLSKTPKETSPDNGPQPSVPKQKLPQ